MRKHNRGMALCLYRIAHLFIRTMKLREIVLLPGIRPPRDFTPADALVFQGLGWKDR